MTPPLSRRWLRWIAAVLIAAGGAAWLAAQIAGDRAAVALQNSIAADARLRAALLDSEIARFRLLPLALADDRDVVGALSGDARAQTLLDRKLEALARDTGAAVIYMIGADGRAIAASNWRTPQSFVGTDYSFRRYFRDARSAGQASQFALGTVSRRPGLYLARRTAQGGVIVVKLAFDQVEREWARAGGITLVRGSDGIVLVTSRPDWRFATTRPLPSIEAARFRAEAQLPSGTMRALPLDSDRFAAADAASAEPGWRLTVLRPIAPAIGPARRTAAAVAALAIIALALLLWGLRERSRTARRRTHELEQAVSERTAALTREIQVRAESEARAAELREGLRQSNRLATLGQVTASVAHETAQPIAAIRTYAQTSAVLLDRGAADEVRANLAAIARLADRVGTVTSELRGFSRRGAQQLRPVALAEVIDGALLILREQLRDIAVDAPAIDPALRVMGGKVRLEQVLVNLLQNAAEALAGRPDPRIAIALSVDDGKVLLTIADNGPGIPDAIAERLFTPFVTSRPNGLGLGLVISQDIMSDLGGGLQLIEGGGGARFEIRMQRA